MASNTHEFEAIGTRWWLERLDGGKFSPVIQRALADYTAEFDLRYSRFRDDSLLMQLARQGRIDNPPAEMIAMLEYSKQLFDASEGAFNLSIGATLHELGYGKQTHGGQVIPVFDDMVTWTSSVVNVPKGLVLDFGGFGKGWLIDGYAKILREHKVKHFIVNGGGDLYVDAKEPTLFTLEHPYDSKLKIGDIQILKGALAGSSTVKRVWKRGDETLHHIIDPATGKPTHNEAVATFVCAHTALVADSLATILLIRPELQEELERQFVAESVVITKDQLE